MKMIFSRVILSANSSPAFINFWPIAVKSWETVFGITPTLAYVISKKSDEKLLPKLEKFGQVIPVHSNSRAPIQNQGKMARWFIASQTGSSVTLIDDIDSIFLEPSYLLEKLDFFDGHTMLGIGSEVYSGIDFGKFPATNLTGTGEQFATLFRYRRNMKFESFLNQFIGSSIYDDREDPFNSPKNFSDESLIRALSPPGLIKVVPRDLDTRNDWVDRLNWPNVVTPSFLEGRSIVNFPRPLYENRVKAEYFLNSYFPDGYPWIVKRRSYFSNPDSNITRIKSIFFQLLK